ncbi:uncharacterized protein LOC134280679 [Saccostrea cucullata]|uniref:uncharacterized protein LOC134280679 n=1 Tax=Saccostrea cuccullata TaxID=36930 RepID=UPI002ED5AA70
MASQPNPSDRSRFAKLGMAVHEELTQACRDVIEMDVSPANLHKKMKASSIYKILRPYQKLRLLRAKTEGYKEFDITLLYTLIRNISSTIPLPTKGKWGGNTMPTVGEITIGDDIERIRWIRNNILGHISSASYISQKEFYNTWSTMTDICHRLQIYTKKDYMFGMSNIQRQALEEEIENAIIEKLEEDYRYNLSLMEMLSSEEQHVLELQSKSDKKVLIQGTNNMASQLNPSDRSRFAKLGMAVHEELTQACRDVIEMNVSPAHLYKKMKGSSIYEILRPKQKLRLLRAKNEGYKEFDITLLYTLIRNISSTIPLPTKGKWGGNTMPTVGEITIGDDIERIRWIRNNMLGHISSASISQKEFNNTWSTMTDICQRLQLYTKKDYMFGVDNIERQALEEEIENAVIEKLEKDYKYNLSLMEMMSSEEPELKSESEKKGFKKMDHNIDCEEDLSIYRLAKLTEQFRKKLQKEEQYQ